MAKCERDKTGKSPSRREFLRLAGGGALALLGTSAFADVSSPEGKRPPNIIFIITDDQRREQFNYLPESDGKNPTPVIDRLSSEGVTLMNHYVSTSVCTPSRYTCLTGRYASRCLTPSFKQRTENEGQSVVSWNTWIVEGEDTLPRRLKAAGYRTGMAGKNHTIQTDGLEPVPYDADPRDPEIAKRLRSNYAKTVSACKAAGFDHAGSIYHNNPDHGATRELAVHNLDWIAQSAVEFIDNSKDQPFFLYFATTVPHGPLGPGRDWRADPLATPAGYLDEAPDVLPPRETIGERLDKMGITNPVQGNLLWLDDAVGALVERLEEHGIADNTVIFYFNDHGTNTGKGSLYEGGLATPCFVWGPGVLDGGRAEDALTSNADFAPTILELAGVKDPQPVMDGRSLLPLLKGQSEIGRDSVYGEIGYSRCVIKDGWKYLAVRFSDRIKNMPFEERKRLLDRTNADLEMRNRPVTTRDPNTPFTHLGTAPGGFDSEWKIVEKYPNYFDPDQLYYLPDDPEERNNLAGDTKHAAKLKEMQDLLKQYLANLPGGFGDLKKAEAG